MRRELLLFDEIIAASQRAHDIASSQSVEDLAKNLNAPITLMSPGASPFDCATASCTVTGRLTSTSSTRLRSRTFPNSLSRSALSQASCRLRPHDCCQ